MTRIQRQIAYETMMARDHYRLSGRRGLGHRKPASGCPECASVILTATWAMSAAWHPVDVAKLFAKGQTRGVCAPKHDDYGPSFPLSEPVETPASRAARNQTPQA